MVKKDQFFQWKHLGEHWTMYMLIQTLTHGFYVFCQSQTNFQVQEQSIDVFDENVKYLYDLCNFFQTELICI